MDKKQIRATFFVVLVCMVVSFAYSFFLKYREERMPSHLREDMRFHAVSACLNSPDLKATPTEALVASYCFCYVREVLDSMSDGEITIAADQKIFDTADLAKASLAQRHCHYRLYPVEVK